MFTLKRIGLASVLVVAARATVPQVTECIESDRDALFECKSIETQREREDCYRQFNRNGKKCNQLFASTEECRNLATSFPQHCLAGYVDEYTSECQSRVDALTTECGGFPRTTIYKTMVIKQLYNFSQIQKTYANAVSQCVSWGGRLASITSAEDSQQIKNYLDEKEADAPYWIGLSAREQKGTWKWTKGAADEVVQDFDPSSSFTDWQVGRPLDPKFFRSLNADCVNLSATKERKWRDSTCDLEYRYICKKETQVDGIAVRIIPPLIEVPKAPEEEEEKPVLDTEVKKDDGKLLLEEAKKKAVVDAIAANARNQEILRDTEKRIEDLRLLEIEFKKNEKQKQKTVIYSSVAVAVVITIGLSILIACLIRYFFCKVSRDTEVHMKKSTSTLGGMSLADQRKRKSQDDLEARASQRNAEDQPKGGIKNADDKDDGADGQHDRS